MITDCAELPLPELHNHVMEFRIPRCDDPAHRRFYLLVGVYRLAATITELRELATTCDRRRQRDRERMPLDLIIEYLRLARLARWRAQQLEAA